MSTIIKTKTQGFRANTFRNQNVQLYYSHLQSVMRVIEPSGSYDDLFAKPDVDARSFTNGEIEWSSSYPGMAYHLFQLPQSQRESIEKAVDEAFSRIDAYVASNKDKSGKSRDYSQFLSIVAKRPDSNQIWVVNGKPVIVQWGFIDENNLIGSSGIYSNWESFLKDIKRQDLNKTEATLSNNEDKTSVEQDKVSEAKVETKTEVSNLFKEDKKVEKQEKALDNKREPMAKEPEKAEVKEEKKVLVAGLGGYAWVKWLAIILAIIILILLLLRTLFPNQSLLGSIRDAFQGGSFGSPLGAGGGSPMGGAGGDSSGGAGDNGVSSNKKNPIKGNCPKCGDKGSVVLSEKSIDSNGLPVKGTWRCSKCRTKGTIEEGEHEEEARQGEKDSQNEGLNQGGGLSKGEGGRQNDQCDLNRKEKKPSKATDPLTAGSGNNSEQKYGLNSDICPVCQRQFAVHSQKELKNCILVSQRDKLEIQKRLEEFESATEKHDCPLKKESSVEGNDRASESSETTQKVNDNLEIE